MSVVGIIVVGLWVLAIGAWAALAVKVTIDQLPRPPRRPLRHDSRPGGGLGWGGE